MGAALSLIAAFIPRAFARPASPAYDPAARELTYTTADGERVLAEDSIVVIVPAKDGNGYTILAIEEPVPKPDAEAPAELPTLTSVPATELPDTLLKSYAARPPPVTPTELHVVISVLSGAGQAHTFHTSLLAPLLSHLPLPTAVVHSTTSPHTITELTTTRFLPAANAGKAQHIVILSGDGGPVDLINGLMASPHGPAYVPPTISVLPLGTANALAHSAGVTRDGTHGLSVLARGTGKRVPLFKATFSAGARALSHEGRQADALPETEGEHALWGAVVASWGLHAGLVADSDTAEYRKYGVERFGMAAREAVFPSDGGGPHVYRGKVRVRTGGKWREVGGGEHAYVLVTLVSHLEKGFCISPASGPLGGGLRLVYFGPRGGEDVMRIMGLAYQGGKHVDDSAVTYEEVEERDIVRLTVLE
ncbi:hypothetical protein EJ06DRAFT_113421 [Trichodelitschia bisporula]|uniref:DAGKc domain-containing protein n=1 Tax=Trichodelitschia bisporula TaxID=703511 RepID=A0A6G1HRH9_9PEZI|nr:hypothetical protein EJ06DRAFT_113421 [Trichodelitschia bisporula]